MRYQARVAFLLFAGAAISPCQEIPPAWTKLMTIQAEARQTKLNGRPWDPSDLSVMPPLPHIFGAVFFPVTSPAPDMLICIADESGSKRCHQRPETNVMGVPYSLCQDSFACTLESVAVPENYIGVLVADLDFLGVNDFVMAHIVYSGPKDPRRILLVERTLHEIAREWHVADAPTQFLSDELATCTRRGPCVPRGGAGWLGYEEAKVEECGETISMTLRGKDPGESLPSLQLEIADLNSDCSGSLEFHWDFGDGKTALTTAPSATHVYENPGVYKVAAMPRCRRQVTVCEAPRSTREFTVK